MGEVCNRPPQKVVQRLFNVVKSPVKPRSDELQDKERPAAPTTPAGPLRFGPGGRFELRPAEYRLLQDGQPAGLGGRALDLLMALAARPHELLTKSELLEIVWPGLVVEEGNLRVQINALRRLLGEDAIATVPGRGYRLTVAFQDEPSASSAAAAPPARASAAQRLFGRDADLARLEAWLGGHNGCITLAGTPGVGKSSLARVARARWRGRSAWVDLAPLTLGGQVASAIARALGGQLGDGDAAAQLLRLVPPGEPLLLVLDNAEHLIEHCAAWVSQLCAAPTLQLLVTSQLPLAVSSEQVLRLEPLQVADGALALLVERIAEADRRFQVTPAALPLLNALCRHLDGLPLALEMAAARVPLMGLQAVHDALAERFALLSRGRRDSPARHRTLEDALAWSYGLLGEPEQRLFRAMGVFAGGFSLDLAVMLTTDEHVRRWDVVDGLATLVERSLVTVNGEDPPRYRLLETMRAYALGKLRSAGSDEPNLPDESHSLCQRHAAAVLALFADGGAAAPMLAEMENMREAFLWARGRDLATAAQLSARAAKVIGYTTWRQEVTEWMLQLRPTMDQAPGLALPTQTQALWWGMLAYLLGIRRDPGARLAAKRAAALWQQLGQIGDMLAGLGNWVRSITEPGAELDEACAALQQAAQADPSPRNRVRLHSALAVAARVRGDTPALLACCEQHLLAAREAGLESHAQTAENNACTALFDLGRHAEAAERAQALLQRIDTSGGGDSNGNLPWVLNVLIESLTALGSLAEASALVRRSLSASRRFDTTVAWQGILVLVAAQQRFDAAGRLIGHVHRQWAASGATPDRDERARLERVEAAVQARLGAEAAAALTVQGRALDDEAAAALAASDV